MKKINNAHTVSLDPACVQRVALLTCPMSPVDPLERNKNSVTVLLWAWGGAADQTDTLGRAAFSIFAVKPDKGWG